MGNCSRPLVLFELILAAILISLLFYLYPQIDLYVSGLFYENGNFLLAKGQPFAWIADGIHYGMRATFFAGMVICGGLLSLRKAPLWLSARKYLFVLLSVALAAGLMTNVVLKDHWGRARPNQIVEFGGNRHFTPVWVISDQCNKNCSFVGGDVSFAFCFLAVALLARRRRLWVGITIAFGTVVSGIRLAAGAHFLSDCVLAALLTIIMIVIFHNIYYASNIKGMAYGRKVKPGD